MNQLARLLAAGAAALGSLGLPTLWPDGPPRTAHADPVAAGPFTQARTCALCHSASENATALWSDSGDDVSPHGLWQATMMANSFRDPYWRAQVAKEVAAAGDDAEGAARIEALCLTCHGPAAHHTARLAERESPGVLASAEDPLARDGVTCTVCHQARPDNLGDAESFSGNLDIRAEDRIYGPYERPFFRPMLMHTGYTATYGPHIRSSALCGSCHTLYTHHAEGSEAFAEQTPYLEWRNSVYSDEGVPADERPESARSCQECHMPDEGTMRIARNPRGFDFNIPAREGFRGHSFVGANAFMLDLLRENAEELGVEASAEALERGARATRKMLAHRSAAVSVEGLASDGEHVTFAVRVENRAGHKLPTGYPARRAWLRVQVRSGRDVVFESGGVDPDGRIRGLEDPLRSPHHDLIESPDQVQIYETIAADADGKPTTHLTRMATTAKDNRLLPVGWRVDGPHAEDTLPVGTEDDADFADGGDVVRFRVPANVARKDLVVVVWLLYQPVPPHWVDALRGVGAEETERFVRMYDAADKGPETLALTVAVGEE
jgi:hypothetical protein